MDRTDLGSWGDGLPPDELAGALAAALILSARPRPHSWHQESVGINARELLDLVQNAGTPSGAVSALLDLDLVSRWPPARVLLQAWNTMLDDLDYAHFPIRLQIEGWQRHDPGWVLHLLRETSGSTNVCSAYLAQPREGGGRRWHMPLRVGFLPDARSQDLRERLGSADYDWLTELVTLRPGVESCDLLLLPHALQGAMAALKALPFRPGAAVVLVLEQGYVPVEDALPPAKDLQTVTECGALGWLDIVSDDLVGWFSDLVRELSHDHPLDLALFAAAEYRDTLHPTLLADPSAVASTRLSATATSIVDQLVGRASAAKRPVPIPWRLADMLRTEEDGLTENGELVPERVVDFRDRVFEALDARAFAFNAESGDATDFLELNYAVRELAGPPPVETRQAQVRVQQLEGPDGPVVETRGLVVGQAYGFDVRVALPDPTWMGAPEAFPDEDIDFSRGPVELTVVFSEPGLCEKPLVDRILLPPDGSGSGGTSTECRFVVSPPQGLTAFRARVAFVYRNRVLQTVLVTGSVVDRMADLDQAMEGIDVSVEAIVNPSFADLDDRRRFDAAVVLNHTASGERLAMAMADGKASWVATERFRPTVQRIRDRLTAMSHDVSADRTLYASLDADETNRLLVELAIDGSDLYRGLIEDWGLEHLRDAKRIQIVATDFDRFFPLEFFYDREVPEDDARLCITDPQALAQALREGTCPEACPSDMSKVVCPLGFWCLRSVIERHTFNPREVPRGQGDYALIPEGPLGNAPPLQPLKSAVFGASRRVDKVKQGLRDSVMAALVSHVTEAGRAETWTAWKAQVKAVSPSLLLIMPHTVEQQQRRAMEIGKQARLIGSRIRKDHVRPDEDQPPPIVFLLGCGTGVDNVDFDTFIAGFRRAKAALVVTTLATVLGRHVAPIALAFLEELSGLDQPEPFGETALAVRQRLFAEGLVTVLTLAVYGDADWLVAA